MTISKLSSLQREVLEILADFEPPWTLVGGAALAGFHTFHRSTRDLDLFFRPLSTLGVVVDEVKKRLDGRALRVVALQSSPMFCRIAVRNCSEEEVLVDLVADPTPTVAAPASFALGDVSIRVEPAQQLLVSKLCALLSRSELRDLVDVRALIQAGGDLRAALLACPEQDTGFSPLTFGWSVRSLPVERLGAALGMSPAETTALAEFRDALVERVVAEARPDSPSS